CSAARWGHSNTGNGNVISEIQGLNETCQLRFHTRALDAEFSQKVAVDQVIEAVTTGKGDASGSTSPPCSYLGAVLSRITLSTAMITSLHDYFQLSYSTATELDTNHDDLYPLHARVTPSLVDSARNMLLYLYNELGVRHLALLRTDTLESQAYSVALQHLQPTVAPELQLVEFAVPDIWTTAEIINEACKKLKDTRFTYFLAAVKVENFSMLWEAAVAHEIAGTGRHNWLAPVGQNYFSNKKFPVWEQSSPQAKAGLGFQVVHVEGSSKHPVFENLMASLREFGASTLDKEFLIDSILPKYQDSPTENATSKIYESFVARNSKFLQGDNLPLVGWMYDSAISAGLAACQAVRNGGTLTGRSHFESLVETVSFVGATGTINYDPLTGTRQTARYSVFNIQSDPARSNVTHIAFETVATGMFIQGEYEMYQAPIFNDGTTVPTADLPPPSVDTNYLSVGLRAACLAMSAAIVVTTISASTWVLRHAKAPVVLSSQPFFLHVVALGVAVVGLSIVPLTFDEGATQDQAGCDAACLSFPWLLSIGFSLTFSALSAKTHRINIILNNPTPFRRMTVSVLDVAKPMLLVLIANVAVLSLWTALSPLECATEVLALDEFDRPSETRSFCTSEDALVYLIVLGIINLGPLLFALYEAYVARDISLEYSEGIYIFKAMMVISAVCLVGIPVLVIAYDNPSTFFFVLSAIIFVACMSIMLLMFMPKVGAYREYKKMNSGGNSGGSNSATLTASAERKKSIPDRFSRRPTGSEQFLVNSTTNLRRIPSGGDVMGSNDVCSGDGSSSDLALGLKILKHPRIQEELEEENRALLEKNKELSKKLGELTAGEHDTIAIAMDGTLPPEQALASSTMSGMDEPQEQASLSSTNSAPSS
ncbi:MAG: hypothetical protein SGILL_008676, partial [Bacillariaceae sp.]